MKRRLLVFAASILFSKGYGQEPFEQAFHKQFNYEVVSSLKLPGGKMAHFYTVPEDHSYVLATDSLGTMLWEKRLENTEFGSTHLLSNGNLFCGGVTDYCTDIAGPHNLFFYELDAEGNEINQFSLENGLLGIYGAGQWDGRAHADYGSDGKLVAACGRVLLTLNSRQSIPLARDEVEEAENIRWVRLAGPGRLILGEKNRVHLSDEQGNLISTVAFSGDITRFADLPGGMTEIYLANERFLLNNELQVVDSLYVPELDMLNQVIRRNEKLFCLGTQNNIRMLVVKDTFDTVLHTLPFDKYDFSAQSMILYDSLLVCTGMEKIHERYYNPIYTDDRSGLIIRGMMQMIYRDGNRKRTSGSAVCIRRCYIITSPD